MGLDNYRCTCEFCVGWRMESGRMMKENPMFEMTVTLSTPFFDGDEDIVYPLTLQTKREVRKVENALMRGLLHLGKMADDALDTPSGVFAGTDPQEVHLTYLVERDGAKWTKAVHEWPNQTDTARAFLKGMLDQLMREEGHATAKQRRPKK